MSKGDNSPGMSKLAGVLKGIANGAMDESLVLDFGEIQDDGSLVTNTYPVAIPLDDYVVCRHLQAHSATTSNPSGGDLGGHSHTVPVTQQLKVGDRVLVAWVQDDPVVVDVIISANEVL